MPERPSARLGRHVRLTVSATRCAPLRSSAARRPMRYGYACDLPLDDLADLLRIPHSAIMSASYHPIASEQPGKDNILTITHSHTLSSLD